MRHVSSRWLTTGPALKRIVPHWESLKELFLNFLNRPDADDNSKRAARSEASHFMVEFLKPAEKKCNLARIKFATFMAEISKLFLTVLQSEKPQIHQLYTLCHSLITDTLALIIDPEDMPETVREIMNLDLDDEDSLLPPDRCDFGGEALRVMRDISSATR